MKKNLILIMLFLISIFIYSQETDNRIALVIGNANYTESPLRNPRNDARDVSTTLRTLGFDVNTLLDANQREMEDAVYQFGSEITGGGIALFYYSGHGTQYSGENYLIPIDSITRSAVDLRYNAVAVGQVLGYMNEADNELNIIILDACRNNPFKGFKDENRGLAVIETIPESSIVIFATAPGQIAFDGTENNSPFTESFLNNVTIPNLEIKEVFNRIGREVLSKTQQVGHPQRPWISYDSYYDFYFLKEEEDEVLLLGELAITTRTADNKSIRSEIYIDGELKGHAPVLVDALPLNTPISVEARYANLYGIENIELTEKLNGMELVLQEMKGNLFISCLENNLELFIDGESFGQLSTGLFKNISLGEHTAELKGDGLYWQETISIEGQETTTINAEVQEAGHISYLIPEDAICRINKGYERYEISGKGTLNNLPTGDYYAIISGDGYRLKNENIWIDKGTVYDLDPELQEIGKLYLSLPKDSRARISSTEFEQEITFSKQSYPETNYSYYYSIPNNTSSTSDLIDKSIEVPVGIYSLEVTKHNYRKYSDEVTIGKGDILRLEPQLERITAYIEIIYDDEMGREDIRIDDIFIGRTPFTLSELPGGEIALKIGSSTENVVLEDQHRYRIVPNNQIHTKPLLIDARSLPGYITIPEQPPLTPLLTNAIYLPGHKTIPIRPELLPESKIVTKIDESKKALPFGALALIGFPLGEGVAFLINQNEDPINILYGIPGVLVGLLIEYIFAPKIDVESPIDMNIRENQERISVWEEEKQQIEEYNRRLVDEANNRIEEENEEILRPWREKKREIETNNRRLLQEANAIISEQNRLIRIQNEDRGSFIIEDLGFYENSR